MQALAALLSTLASAGTTAATAGGSALSGLGNFATGLSGGLQGTTLGGGLGSMFASPQSLGVGLGQGISGAGNWLSTLSNLTGGQGGLSSILGGGGSGSQPPQPMQAAEMRSAPVSLPEISAPQANISTRFGMTPTAMQTPSLLSDMANANLIGSARNPDGMKLLMLRKLMQGM